MLESGNGDRLVDDDAAPYADDDDEEGGGIGVDGGFDINGDEELHHDPGASESTVSIELQPVSNRDEDW